MVLLALVSVAWWRLAAARARGQVLSARVMVGFLWVGGTWPAGAGFAALRRGFNGGMGWRP